MWTYTKFYLTQNRNCQIILLNIDVFEVITVHFKTFPVQEILAITSYVNNVILRVGMFLYLDFGKGILSVE